MGIPSLARWIQEHHGSIVTKNFIADQLDETIESYEVDEDEVKSEPVDYLFIDWNCGIHPAARSAEPDKMFETINAYLDYLVSVVNPRKLVYIAVDGVAPRAKQSQQRQRRYHSHYIKSFTKSAKHELGLELPTTDIDYNMISPGTQFMTQLTMHTKRHIETKILSKWKHLTVVFSDSSVPGEGEHKIMKYIRALPTDDESSIVVYGMDADLLMLCLANYRPKMALVREEVHFNRGKPTETHAGSTDASFCYFSIDRFRDALVTVLAPSTTLTMLENWKIFSSQTTKKLYSRYDVIKQRQLREMKHRNFGCDDKAIISDYIFICFLLGNDFIHKLPCLSIKDDGISIILAAYKLTQMEQISYLMDESFETFNLEFLIHMMGLISDLEAGHLRYMNYRRDKRAESFKHRRSYKAADAYHRKIMEFECVEQRTKDSVLMGTTGWSQRYYNYFSGGTIDKTNKIKYRAHIESICYRYLEGLIWVWKYYTNDCTNWHWYQIDNMSPTARDFHDYLVTLRGCTMKLPSMSVNNPPVKPLEQLMMILPADSATLLPKNWATLMIDSRSPLIKYYPRCKMNLFTIGKSYLHECIMELPIMPYEDVRRTTQSLPDETVNIIRSLPDHIIEPGVLVYSE